MQMTKPGISASARLLPGSQALTNSFSRCMPVSGIWRVRAVTGELYEAVWQWAREAGWATWFMGCSDPRVSFVAHGLGVEVDEFPFIAQGQKLELQQGMVFAFEPKVIIPDEGIAGLENTYLVTSDGIESLNTATEELVIV